MFVYVKYERMNVRMWEYNRINVSEKINDVNETSGCCEWVYYLSLLVLR